MTEITNNQTTPGTETDAERRVNPARSTSRLRRIGNAALKVTATGVVVGVAAAGLYGAKKVGDSAFDKYDAQQTEQASHNKQAIESLSAESGHTPAPTVGETSEALDIIAQGDQMQRGAMDVTGAEAANAVSQFANEASNDQARQSGGMVAGQDYITGNQIEQEPGVLPPPTGPIPSDG
jgi:hypothetical protein